jgi:signal transduction histidine kinase
MANTLAAYYEQQGSWDGAETLLGGLCNHVMGSGRGFGRHGTVTGAWYLADPEGNLIIGSGRRSGLTDDELSTGVPVSAGGQTVAYLVPAMGENAYLGPSHQRFLGGMYTALAWSGIIAVVIALAVGVFLSSTLTRPLAALAQAASDVARGEFSRRVDIRSGDEVGELSRSFNRMARDLEDASALRRRLTADIAHELRTPISVIQGHLEAMMDGVFPADVEHIASVHEETRLLGRLVDDLRTLTLVEAGELSLEMEEMDLANVVRRSVSSFLPLAQEKNISLEEPPEDARHTVHGDADRIGQVMGILLSNAIRHTPEGGSVRVSIRQDANGARVEVKDSGSGIDPEDLPQVFERFWRADASRSRDTGGTGLGLAIAKELVQAHDGTIRVESRSGSGTTFSFVLPTG